MTDFRDPTSILGLVIFVAIRTLEHSIYIYFLSRNIICKKVSTLAANVLKSPAGFSSYEGSVYIAAFVIVSFFVDRPCSCSRFSNDSTFNYNHLLYFVLKIRKSLLSSAIYSKPQSFVESKMSHIHSSHSSIGSSVGFSSVLKSFPHFSLLQ